MGAAIHFTCTSGALLFWCRNGLPNEVGIAVVSFTSQIKNKEHGYPRRIQTKNKRALA